jgi:hypothetical protein
LDYDEIIKEKTGEGNEHKDKIKLIMSSSDLESR